ncbi:hypothetical protein IWX49DRAFT_576724 [Phyllosticta citricarpa]|uniref:Uncharacterized protein n=2 Tax=Phyllosticta TaxID=121621 RepID=A0ABR1M3G1_9PEZI
MALVTRDETPAFIDIPLAIGERVILELRYALIRRNRCVEADSLRFKVLMRPSHRPFLSGVILLRSASDECQMVQKLWLSLVDEERHLRGAGCLIRQVCRGHHYNFIVGFEPPAYGIDPKALLFWPGYSRLARISLRPHVEGSWVKTLLVTNTSTKRPAECTGNLTTEKKRKVIDGTSSTNAVEATTSTVAIKREDGPNEQATETPAHLAWKEPEQRRGFDVSFQALGSIRNFL